MSSNGFFPARFLFALVCAIAAFALVACGSERATFNGTDLTGAAWGRDFSLQDPDGRTRTLADFRGRYVLLFFGFTHCPEVCPTALLRAAEMKKKLGVDGARVQVIFVTVDPERDTAELLRNYTGAFDPQGRLRLGLRHTQSADEYAADLRTLMKQFP